MILFEHQKKAFSFSNRGDDSMESATINLGDL